MVNGSLKTHAWLWTLVPCAVVLGLAAWLRGAEYDEQYTLFLTSGVPRPDWPSAVFPAGLARQFQSGNSSLARIAHDLRITDVHPPLYFWLVSLWRAAIGHGLFEARLLSVVLGLGALALTGAIARLARLAPVWAILLTMGCYGFTYTSLVARGFALAQLLLLGGVVCLLLARRSWHFVLAGALMGAATMSNYLAVFVAGACLLAVGWGAVWRRPYQPFNVMAWLVRATCRGTVLARVARTSRATTRERASAEQNQSSWVNRLGRPSPLHLRAIIGGFLIFIPADLWWFLAQRDSRLGQFPAFSISQTLARLAARFAGDLLGGLPLYAEGTASAVLAAFLGLLLIWMLVRVVGRWRHIGIPRARTLFVLGAIAPPVGLLALGAIFNTTPIEVRYLSFATPFIGLLLAGALEPRGAAFVLAVQAAALAGLMLAPQTMQPARAAAQAAAALVEDGVVLLPRGNDGVGVVGAFAIEAPPALPLLLIRAEETQAQIRARIASWHRVVLALLEQDASSRAASEAMRRALMASNWREVARQPNVAVYERIGERE